MHGLQFYCHRWSSGSRNGLRSILFTSTDVNSVSDCRVRLRVQVDKMSLKLFSDPRADGYSIHGTKLLNTIAPPFTSLSQMAAPQMFPGKDPLPVPIPNNGQALSGGVPKFCRVYKFKSTHNDGSLHLSAAWACSGFNTQCARCRKAAAYEG